MSGEPVVKRMRKSEDFELNCINTVRVLSADQVESAKSGHPGAPMGCAPIAHVLWGEVMNYAPLSPEWSNRDRFVLSNGHASALLYSMLHLSGYNLPLEELMKFRQLGSLTPGHPENVVTAGVEVSTGPLGQGLSNAVGLAMAEKHLAATFNKDGFPIVDHYTYVLCGDGCLQEGVTSEASSLAGHLGLGKLIVCYDDNHITIDGDTALSFTEDVAKRYEAYGWHVQTVDDVTDMIALRESIAAARAETDKPSLIKIRTTIGHGSAKEGSSATHGAALGKADLDGVKKKFGFEEGQSFHVPADVREYYTAKGKKGTDKEMEWKSLFSNYSNAHPELAKDYTRREMKEFPEGFFDGFPIFTQPEPKALATRQNSEAVLNYVATQCPEIIGGSADLSPSNLTVLKCSGDFQSSTPAGRYIRFGVREHAMVAVCNGMFAHGMVRPFCATFLNFMGYAMGAVRVTALSDFGVIFVMTHDSIGLGEDGPTHQPVEMLTSLRAMPNLNVVRPADGNEVSGAYMIGMQSLKTPTVIALSRQGTPTLEGTSAQSTLKGAYTLQEFNASAGGQSYPTLTLVGSGTELNLCVKTANVIATKKGCWVRVVSMPCWEFFAKQTLEYQQSVFLSGSPVLAVEASGTLGWKTFAHACVGLERFGYSAPAGDLYKHFGFGLDNLEAKAEQTIAFYTKNGDIPVAPSLIDYPRFEAPKPLYDH